MVNKNHISSKYPILNFEEVLREHFPEIDIRPAIGNKSCWNCASLVECDVSQLRDIENSIREMLRWRNYDELIQMKKVFNEVSKKSQNLNDEYDKRQLYKEFKVVEKKLQKKIHNLFPKINRWSSLITMLSIPVIVAGVSSQSPFIAGLGAGVAGVAQSLKSYSDFLSNKLRWLCYRQENRL